MMTVRGARGRNEPERDADGSRRRPARPAREAFGRRAAPAHCPPCSLSSAVLRPPCSAPSRSSSRPVASRLTGAASTVAGAMAIGLVIALPVALVFAPAPDFGGDALLWMTLSGFGNVLGLLLTYAAYRIGAVGIISTIDSTEGAVAAVLSVLAGEILVPGSGIVLAVIAVGVVLAASAGGSEEGVPITRDRADAGRDPGRSVGDLLRGRRCTARPGAANVLPVAWAILPPRVVGVAFVALPLVVLGRFRMTRAALPVRGRDRRGRGSRLLVLHVRRPREHRGRLGPELDVRADRGHRRVRRLPASA